jgi:hypothetical protein
MVEKIIAEIDAEIARLQQVRTLLAPTATTGKKRGRPAKGASAPSPLKKAAGKRQPLSAEARERMRQGQLARWKKKRQGKA